MIVSKRNAYITSTYSGRIEGTQMIEKMGFGNEIIDADYSTRLSAMIQAARGYKVASDIKFPLINRPVSDTKTSKWLLGIGPAMT